MNLGLYGMLIIVGLFIILLAFNPNISCFGKKLKSPFYPLFRKKRRRKITTVDYGFDLGGEEHTQGKLGKQKRTITPQDYGFDLGGRAEKPPYKKKSKAGRNLAEEDYGFNLSGSSPNENPEEKPKPKDN